MNTLAGVLFDLDNTLVVTDKLEGLRHSRRWDLVYQQFHETWVPPGTQQFLLEISNHFQIGVVTSSPRTYATKLLTHHDLKVPVVTAFHDTTRRKPFPDPLWHACQQLDLIPAESIYIGDSAVDVEAALQAGLRVCLVDWTGSGFVHSQAPRVQTWDQLGDALKLHSSEGRL